MADDEGGGVGGGFGGASGGKRKPPPQIPSEPELYDPSLSAVKCEVVDGDSSFPEGSSSSRKKEE